LEIRKIKVENITGYNHGGGLDKDVIYFPELNTTISIASVEADKKKYCFADERSYGCEVEVRT
jgi:hypothetical protein